MISYYGIASAPISGDVVYSYDVTAATSPPSLTSTINFYFNVAATTSVPSIALDLETSVLFDVLASTRLPSIEMSLYSSNEYVVASSTKLPLVAIGLQRDLYIDIASSTSLPTLNMDFQLGNIYNVASTTNLPYLSVQITTPQSVLASTAYCVNLTTGGHTRYTNYPDATATSTLESYVDSALIDFGITSVKHVHDIYIKSRACEAEMAIGTTVDEHMVRTGYRVSLESSGGLHRRRCRLPKGVRGVSWKFRIGNVDNSSIEVTQAEVLIAPTVRHQ